MLRLFVKDHGRFQTRPEAALSFQPGGQRCAIERLAMRTQRLMLPRLNHLRRSQRSLGNLSAGEIFRSNVRQIGQTMCAFGDGHLNQAVGIFD
jgi:hypothetical protein